MWNAGFNDFNGHTTSYTPGPTNAYGNQGLNNSASGMSICKISDLSPGIIKDKIVGVTISKEAPRHFASKKDPSQERYVMSFTLRDSPADFINVTCWGNQGFIQDLGTQFHIGDVVEITNAGVQSKPMDGSDEKFHPWTPSAYQLIVSESRSTISLYTGWDTGEYMGLSHIPVKASNDFYTIADVLTNGTSLDGENISLLAAVRSVGPAKEVTSKSNKPLRRCEVKLLDETTPSFSLILWDEEQINLVQNWTPKDTVVFAADVRAKYDDYRKTMVATATSKTIFTVNPDTREAHSVYQYAQNLDLPAEDVQQVPYSDVGKSVDLNSIQTVLSIEQCKEKQVLKDGGGGVVHAIVFAYLTQMDVDGEFSSVVFRCAKCRQRLDQVTNTCINQDCPQGSRFELDWANTEKTSDYEVRLSLSDHTGSLEGCYMNGDVCQNLLQTTTEEYLSLTKNQRTQLKWQHLLELCKVYIRISLPSYDRMTSSVRILSCERANPQEAAKHLQ